MAPENFMPEYKYDFKDPENYVYREKNGLREEVVRNISNMKKEQAWLMDFRLKALKVFLSKKMPVWGADLSRINFEEIGYYIKPTDRLLGL